MTACSAKLQSLEYVAEGAWGETSTDMSSGVRIPTLEQVSIEGLTHEMVSPGRVVQLKNDSTAGIPGKQGGSFTFSVHLAGYGSTTASSVAVEVLGDLLGWAIGTNSVSASAGTTVSGGGSTVTSVDTVASATFAAGSLVRIGAKGDSGADGQWAVVNTHTLTALSLRTALPAAPANGAIVYAPETVYSAETSCAVPPWRFQILTADTQWVAHGCHPTGITFDNLGPGMIPTAKITVGVSWFEPVSTTFPSAKSVSTATPSPVAQGSAFFQTHGTTTRAPLGIRSLSIAYALGIQPIMGIDGNSPYQCITGASRTADTVTVTMVVDAGGASTTPTYWTAWLTNAAKHLLLGLSTVDGQALAFYLSRCFWEGNRPTQVDSDGLNRVTVTLRGAANTVTTNDLTRSMFRVGLA